MTAPTAVQETPAPTIPLGPAPSLPDTPPTLVDETPSAGGPSLADAALDSAPETGAPLDAPDAPPMTAEQIIGLVAELSAVGMPPKVATAYKDDFKANPLVNFGVEASGLADALAEYGLTAGGGKLPAWMSVLLGVSVLGYGVYSTRSKYVQPDEHAPRAAEEAGADGFDIAGVSTPLSATNIGFSNAGNQGGGAFVTS